MARNPPNTMKVKIWTGSLTSEMTGSISGCVIEGFNYIMAGKDRTAADNRELALKLMTEQHEKLKAQGL